MTLQSAIDYTLDMIALHEDELKKRPTPLQQLVLEGLYVRLRKLQGELAEEENLVAGTLPLESAPNRTPPS